MARQCYYCGGVMRYVLRPRQAFCSRYCSARHAAHNASVRGGRERAIARVLRLANRRAAEHAEAR